MSGFSSAIASYGALHAQQYREAALSSSITLTGNRATRVIVPAIDTHKHEPVKGYVHGQLGESAYILTAKLPYEIVEGATGWSGYVHHLGLPVYGHTEAEVVEDVQNAIAEYYDILRDASDNILGAIPKRHKIILSSFIEEKDPRSAR